MAKVIIKQNYEGEKMEYFNRSVGRTLQFPELNLIFARFYNIKGANKADEGLLDEALENFDKAVELNPNDAIALFNRATIKADLGDFEGAKEDFHRAKSIASENDEEVVPSLRNNIRDEISTEKINFY